MMKDPGILDSHLKSEEFQELLANISGRTVVTPDRLSILTQLAMNYHYFPAAEVGVYKGGTAFLIATYNQRIVLLFDTFEGMPDCSDKDLHKKGDFGDANFGDVKYFLSKFDNVKIYKGLFEDSIAEIQNSFKYDNYRFGFVHLDADIYSTTLQALEYFYPRMIQGGAILLDDYDFRTTPGCRIAVDEFLSDKPEICINLGTGQGLIIIGGYI